MNFDLKEFISSTMILFAIIDIVGNIPLIVLLTKKLKVNDVFFIGNKMKYAHKENASSTWYENVHDLIRGLEKLSFKNSDILIKGSRSLELEKSLEIIKQISV